MSTPGMQSDAGGFPDDDVVGRRGARRQAPGQNDVPRVVDTTAETLSIQFERFLEKYEGTPSSTPHSYADMVQL